MASVNVETFEVGLEWKAFLSPTKTDAFCNAGGTSCSTLFLCKTVFSKTSLIWFLTSFLDYPKENRLVAQCSI